MMEYNKNNPLRMFSHEELNNEEWRDIEGYEGMYQVSNLGRIKRLPLGKQWPCRQTHNNIRKYKKSNSGYFVVNLSKQNKVKFHFVHRLVATAFIPNTENLPQINHKDDDKTNNRVENLEWCSRKYNIYYGTGIERQKAARKNNEKYTHGWQKAIETRNRNENPNSAVKIEVIDNCGNIKIYESISEAIKKTGHSYRYIKARLTRNDNHKEELKWRILK